MKTKIVYTVVSTDKDIYLEQAMLSIYSLRKLHPDANIVLVTDDVTEDTLVGNRATINNMIDEKIVVEREPSFSGKESAYFIKTNLRELLSGDFLFIDTDTLIVDRLDEIDNCQYEVAAVPDLHVSFKKHYGYEGYLNLFKILGFELRDNTYFNSGVMYVKDTPRAHLLYQKWKESYRSMIKKCFYDQPHLAKADSEVKVLSEIDGTWNCQIMWGLKYLPSAKIVHYFASNFIGVKGEKPYMLMDSRIFENIKESGLDTSLANNLIEKAKSSWSEGIEVNGGKDLLLLHSDSMKVLRILFYNYPTIFKMLNNTIKLIKKIKHK